MKKKNRHFSEQDNFIFLGTICCKGFWEDTSSSHKSQTAMDDSHKDACSYIQTKK